MISRRTFSIGVGASLAAASVSARAQSWPVERLRIIVPTAPGGTPDIVGRLVGDKLAASLRQAVIIESLAQGGGIAGNIAVSRSKPDGTMFAVMTGGHAPQAALRKSLPYDPISSFSFISTMCSVPMVLSVRPQSEIASFPDLLARAKAAPGKLTYAVTALGATQHLFGTWVNAQAGTQMVPISYRGSSPGFTDVLAGRVDMILEPTTSAMPRVRSGQMRVLAVSSPERYPLLPDAPTVAETLPGVETVSWLGIVSAPNTPPAIVNRMNEEIRQALALPDVRQTLAELGTLPMPSTPAEFRERVERDIVRWKKIIVENNIEPV